MFNIDKDRLYVAVYPPEHPSLGEFHWALVVGPKHERYDTDGLRLHIIRLGDQSGSDDIDASSSTSVDTTSGVDSSPCHTYDQSLWSSSSKWAFQCETVAMHLSSLPLARLVIGKVKDRERLIQVIANVPIPDATTDCSNTDNGTSSPSSCSSSSPQPSYPDKLWIQHAIAALEADKKRCLSTSFTTWDVIEQTASSYVSGKRNQKRYDFFGGWNRSKPPTFDMLDDQELIE